jgi:hypothetical protein
MFWMAVTPKRSCDENLGWTQSYCYNKLWEFHL